MSIPNYRQPRVRVFLDRFELSHLTDSDGVPLVDTDHGRLLTTPSVYQPVEITERVVTGSVDLGDVSAVGSSHAGVDNVVKTLSLTLDHGEPSIAPGVASPLNEPDELLRAYRRVRVVADTGEGEHHLFSGYLGDEVRSTISAGMARLQVTARDLAKPLQDLFLTEYPVIAEGAENEPVRADDALRQLLDLAPEHLRPELYVPVLPTFVIREPYKPENMSVWDAMQEIARQMGWYLGVEGDVLAFYDPPRGKSEPDLSLSEDDVFTDDLGVSDTDVRNVITIWYRDVITSERREVTLRDQWSIDNITGGVERRSVIELDDASQVDDTAKALALADRFLADMAREFASTQLTLPFLPDMSLFTLIELRNARVTDAPRHVAVHSVRHEWGAQRARTIVAGTGQVVGKRRAWLNTEPRPGSPNDPRGPHQSILPPPRITIRDAQPGMAITVHPFMGVNVREIEIHWSTQQGFVPDTSPGSSTLKARGLQEKWIFNSVDGAAVDRVQLGLPHYVRARAIDKQGRGGRWSAEHAFTPERVAGKALELDQDVIIHGDLTIFGPRSGGGSNTGTLLFKQGAETRFAVGNVGGLFGAPPGAVGAAGALGTGIWIEGVPMLLSVMELFQNLHLVNAVSQPVGASVAWDIGTFVTTPITVPPVPDGYAMLQLWSPQTITAFLRLLNPNETGRGYGASESWQTYTELQRANGTWTRFPENDPAGTQYTTARLRANGHITITKATPGSARSPQFSINVAGVLALFFVPKA